MRNFGNSLCVILIQTLRGGNKQNKTLKKDEDKKVIIVQWPRVFRL